MESKEDIMRNSGRPPARTTGISRIKVLCLLLLTATPAIL